MPMEASSQYLSTDHVSPQRKTDAAGNRALVLTAVTQYGPLLRAYFNHRLRANDDVDDYLQDLYCRVLAYKNPTGVKSIRVFVFTLAVTLLHDKSRHRGAGEEPATISIDAIDPRETMAIESANPELAAAATQRIAQVQRVIDHFPVKVKRAFLLHRVDGLSQKEISLTLGVSPAAVEKYILAATKLLDQALVATSPP